MRIFAHHAHVFPESVNPEGTIDRLLRLLDHCQIENAVAFAPFAHQVQATGIEPNPWLAKQLASGRGSVASARSISTSLTLKASPPDRRPRFSRH